MKKIVLFIAAILLVAVGVYADDVLTEGFETDFPPTGWVKIDTNIADNNWLQIDEASGGAFLPHEGTYMAWVNYDTPNPSDEWLITSEVDLSAYGTANLSFYMAGSEEWITGANTHVLASTDYAKSKDPTWTEIYLWPGDCPVDFTWCEVNVDISAYAGDSVWIAWQYVGQDGDSQALDEILITAGAGDDDVVDDDVVDDDVVDDDVVDDDMVDDDMADDDMGDDDFGDDDFGDDDFGDDDTGDDDDDDDGCGC